MQISVARCFNYDTFLHLLVPFKLIPIYFIYTCIDRKPSVLQRFLIPSLTAHAGVPSHGRILRSFSGRIVTSTAEAPNRKGDQGDEGWHHNQVWAAGGAVIRPHLENAGRHLKCKAKHGQAHSS